PEEGARTINGLLLEELGDIPTLNTLVAIGHYQFEVVAIGENVIKTVKLSPLKPAGADIAADI
ncbi:magnesium/cobalt efflux protein, partial [Citrobacter cronae]